MISAETVKAWIKEDEDNIYDLDLGYLSEGEVINLATVPEGYELRVVATRTDRSNDSYGYSYLEDGYVVFSVTGPEGSENFKFPVEYASFEGWSYKIDEIAPTQKTEKIVTSWEWV